MRWTAAIAMALGAALCVALVIRHDAARIGAILAGYGWGLPAIALFHGVPLLLASLGWKVLLPRGLPLASVLGMRWIGESVNNLLPAGQVGGDVVRARLLALRGVPAAEAAAGVLADFTAGLAAEMVFAAAGAAVFLARDGSPPAWPLILGLGTFGAIILGFALAQLGGFLAPAAGLAGRLLGRRARVSIVGGAAALDASLRSVYRRRGPLLACAGWRLLAWIAGAGEVWLALRLIGLPVPLLDALALESLVQAVRSAGFLVPGAWGIQEGGLLYLGSALGLTPEVSLSLSLVKRVREILLGAPGILAWQLREGRRAVKRGKA